ncbi:MAG: aa3-type cytochrome c oxidase subunit IV [Paracoccaceae bacterium]
MADYKPGEMNITEQERTFEGFMKWLTWSIAIILVALVLLAFING